jgi:hypothetical protein
MLGLWEKARGAGVIFALIALLGAGCGPGGASPTDGPGPGPGDGGQTDAPLPDAASFEVRVPTPYARPIYQRLSETGLYSNIATKAVAPDALLYQPAHQLWSDGADKRRWIQLPADTQIDTADMDHWRFPIGTKVWKEFSRGGALLETRLIERYGDGEDDYFIGAFIWSPDRQDATLANDGATDVNGTTHDVPNTEQCGDCHKGEAGRILGVSAIQLSGVSSGLTLAALAAGHRLSQPPAPGGYPVPGDANTAAALGYLHANCGNCHGPNTTAWRVTRVDMRLRVAERVANQTQLWQTMVGQPLQRWTHPTITEQVVPGDPAASAIVERMKARGIYDQMPPLATEIADTAGVDLVTRWIASLPR